MAQERRISPRIATLRRRLNAGEDRALDRFWDEARGQGTPLVEPIRGDDRNVLVTFLWRAAETANVVVMSPVLPDAPRAGRLRRIPGTDVWHRSYRMPAEGEGAGDAQTLHHGEADGIGEVKVLVGVLVDDGFSVGTRTSGHAGAWLVTRCWGGCHAERVAI